MNKNNMKRFVLAMSTAVWLNAACATSTFVVHDIRVNGLQRISLGTVLNYLPVQVGETISSESTSEIIRTLYDTGFFQSVSLDRTGDTLIVNVHERPTIVSITFSGNKDIPTDKLKSILKEMNLVKGRVFQRSALERLEKELKQAYNARGKYNARIDTKVTSLSDNRVAIRVSMSEGRVSRIKHIKWIGNKAYSDSELSTQMSLSEKGLLTYFTKKDQYTKASMDASLEAVRSYYFDRGYLKFQIVSSQVMLSPDKKDVFIQVHIIEGPQYRFSGVGISGDPILPRETINRLITIKKGEVFSRKKVTDTISAIGLKLGDKGYGFPNVRAEPKLDEVNKTVYITFFISPGRPVYVRRIHFHGNVKTSDDVLRHVIRQDEGTLLSLHNIKESERQLRQLTYLKDIHVDTTPVEEANNQVDLDVFVEEAPSAEAHASIGYGTNGPQVQAAFNQHNFMGTGRTIGLAFNASYWGQEYAFNYYNPFYTNTGIGRGLNLYYQVVDPDHLNIAAYSVDRYGGDVNYNIPWSELSNVQLGYGFQHLLIRSGGGVLPIQNFMNLYGTNFNEGRLSGGWARNSYDQLPFPTQGTNQQLTGLLSFPTTSESLTYYKSTYSAHGYEPLGFGFIGSLTGNIAYADSLNDKPLPFFENYYAGGIAQIGQVRGFESYSLGPRANAGNSIGGNFLITGSAALIFPYPLSRDTVRTSVFLDTGNVYARGIPPWLTGTDSGPLRYSAGLSVEWRSPFGPLAFSVAKPLNQQPGDRLEFFQFTLSSSL